MVYFDSKLDFQVSFFYLGLDQGVAHGLSFNAGGFVMTVPTKDTFLFFPFRVDTDPGEVLHD